MKTISKEQFIKQFGGDTYEQFGPSQQQPGFFQRVGTGVKQAVTEGVSGIQEQAEVGAQAQLGGDFLGVGKSLARGGLRGTGAFAKAVLTPITEAPGIKQATEFVGEKLAETAPIKKYVAWAQKHPEAAKDIENTLDIATLLGTKGAAKPLLGGLEKTAKRTGVAATQIAKTTIPAYSSVGEYTAGRLPKLLGIFSGESDDVVRQALVNPKVARIGIEQGDDALRKAVQEGAENSVKIKNTFVQAYSQAKKQTLGQYDKVVIPKNKVKGIFNNLLEKNGVKIGPEGLDFSTSKIVANPGEITKIKAAWDALDKWGKFTLGSVDDYKQLVGKLRRFADEAGIPSKSPFLGELYNELNKVITTNPRIPVGIRQKYSALNKNFSNQIELYDDIVDAFNSGDPFTKLANALGKNKDTLRKTLEFYEKKSGKSVLPIVAGRELAMEKTAAFGFLNPRSWIDLLISPKIQAKFVTKVGEKMGGKLKQ